MSHSVIMPVDENNYVEVDEDDTFEWGDSAYGYVNPSDATSVSSTVTRGISENGRRYQSVKEDGYFIPSDDKQFECEMAGHKCFKIMDCQEDNVLFRSPLGPTPHNIIDLGTGEGSWARDVAVNWPNTMVHGVDLYPPPLDDVPINCVFEVDDITRPWTWNVRFDLVHMRIMAGSMVPTDWDDLYAEVYKNLQPGGWIEQVESEPGVHCDDNTLPADSLLASHGAKLEAAANVWGQPIDSVPRMRERIERPGFVNVHEKNYQIPLGKWPLHPIMKDAGKAGMQTFRAGVEGFVMYLLTKHGAPQPWTEEQVRVYGDKIRKELDQGWHIYQKMKRVWAQKPYEV